LSYNRLLDLPTTARCWQRFQLLISSRLSFWLPSALSLARKVSFGRQV
jgi:hypothetical protein